MRTDLLVYSFGGNPQKGYEMKSILRQLNSSEIVNYVGE